MRFGLIFCLLSAPCYAGQIGIIIGTESGQMRRVIVPDNDAQLHQQNWAGLGETLLVRDASVDITDEIAKFTGKIVTVPLAAVVGKDGLVSSVIVADPSLDTLPGAALVPAFPGVRAGQTFDAKRQVFVEPAREDISVVDISGQPVTETVLVPAQEVAQRPLDMQPPIRLRPAQ